VGLECQAVQEAFSKYLQGATYNERQIRFERIDGVFSDGDADNILGVVEAFNEEVA